MADPLERTHSECPACCQRVPWGPVDIEVLRREVRRQHLAKPYELRGQELGVAKSTVRAIDLGRLANANAESWVRIAARLYRRGLQLPRDPMTFQVLLGRGGGPRIQPAPVTESWRKGAR